ncbi:MAG: DNA polymerase III subunit gamma/tau [Bacteroidaceae bacterium]|nr:DNA polymerase III subunit gamma/tau [Bacteroidaceae bacterium]
MSEYIVSARKYRPMTFDTVVGQSSIATTLKNAIHTGKLAHAYLFCGPRGVGKTTCARIFAKTINCLHPREDGEACNECESCRAFNEQRSLNIHELDAASNNSVDDIRNLIDQVRIPPQIGKYKVFIIDEVHMLSTAAFNAFLKTLEEPPAHAIFILATTEKHKILPTILSRCQIYDFQRMTITDIVRHLTHVAEQEGYTCEPAALNIIAQKADGGMRDALSIFDQVVSYTGGNITYQQVIENLNVLDYDYYFRLIDFLLEKKISESLLLYNEVLSKGFEGGPFISGLASHLRDLLVSRDAQTTQLLEVSEDIRQRYAQQAQRCKPQWLYRAIRLCNDCDQAYRTSRNKRLQVELTLIEAAQATDDDPGAGRRPARHILKPISATWQQLPRRLLLLPPRFNSHPFSPPQKRLRFPTMMREAESLHPHQPSLKHLSSEILLLPSEQEKLLHHLLKHLLLRAPLPLQVRRPTMSQMRHL